MKLEVDELEELIQIDMRNVDEQVLDDGDVDNIGEAFIRAGYAFKDEAYKTLRRFGERRDWDWEPVADSIEVKDPNYEGSRGGMFSQMVVTVLIKHPAATHWDSGMEPRVITPNYPAFALKIPWPDAPPGTTGVVWDDGVKHVLRSRAEPDGYDRIPFMDDGEKAAQRKIATLLTRDFS